MADLSTDLVPTWQPIATAPRDGTMVILCKGTLVTAGSWRANADARFPWAILCPYEAGGGMNGWMDGENGPTHWMPMPDHLPALDGVTK